MHACALACRKALNFDDLWDVAERDRAADVSATFQRHLEAAGVGARPPLLAPVPALAVPTRSWYLCKCWAAMPR